ncbi:anti-sigma F factor antagonist [Tissierella carlieri]|uniref:Anti-sigma F factor antagonist n=1 Tax=Tissierella carlieri TaxID=689904 RepID=A0ABT1SBE1_9FIRM|nr:MULTISPECIES: anti-sigma F factor antagonist [Tissierella]MBU5313571.1 anti-sigma F factor antagonist [Tissierella carlieri]MCQ4923802.1 anti-sigma F factor antagonist [Tissierella carlieri]MDU5083063.1 anti-sigma F factor antagonist [Bacillota bacterium]OZV10447.1 anti-sigma F factor antagonist [Tissierella sp. P1]
MYLSVEKHKNNLLVQFKGELDHHTTENVREKIDQQYFDQRIKNIILDLRGLTFMDSSGIGLIMGRYRNCIDKSGMVAIVSDNAYVDKMLRMSGLLKIINVYPTIEEAAENL